jgi:hypothetical protein
VTNQVPLYVSTLRMSLIFGPVEATDKIRHCAPVRLKHGVRGENDTRADPIVGKATLNVIKLDDVAAART